MKTMKNTNQKLNQKLQRELRTAELYVTYY